MITKFAAFHNYKVEGMGFDAYWDVSDTGNLSFMVQGSEVDTGPWADMLNERTSNFMAAGFGGPTLTNTKVDYFRLQVFKDDVLIEESPGTCGVPGLNRHDYLIYREILRRYRLQLEKYTGNEFLLYRTKTAGPTCPRCVDPVLDTQSSDSQCEVCFGTAITGGYHEPICIWGDAGEQLSYVKNQDVTEKGPAEVKTAQVMFPAYPWVKSFDVLVLKSSNKRFKILKVSDENESAYRQFPVRQIASVTLIPQSDIIYKL